MKHHWLWILVALLCHGWLSTGWAEEVTHLRLVPFPKEVRLAAGEFGLDRPLVLQVPADASSPLATTIVGELRRGGLPAPKVQTVETETPWLRLATEPSDAPTPLAIRDQTTPEDYALVIRPNEILCTAPGNAGLFYGAQTLVQLIRANRRENGLPCLAIRDWPSIVPFAESGYEFFVCPGVSNWSRILPDFGVAETNIYHFVRDGAAHGAIGMLNTAWEDDGEALNGPKWHGYAWGAECAWNASTTTPEAFNARIGAVLFGEQEDHFGQAIGLLAQTHRLADMQGMNNRRFWADDFCWK